jgi:hypothetical protein
MSFVRQVVSLVANPQLLEDHSDLFPSDAVARAKVRAGGKKGIKKQSFSCVVPLILPLLLPSLPPPRPT